MSILTMTPIPGAPRFLPFADTTGLGAVDLTAIKRPGRTIYSAAMQRNILASRQAGRAYRASRRAGRESRQATWWPLRTSLGPGRLAPWSPLQEHREAARLRNAYWREKEARELAAQIAKRRSHDAAFWTATVARSSPDQQTELLNRRIREEIRARMAHNAAQQLLHSFNTSRTEPGLVIPPVARAVPILTPGEVDRLVEAKERLGIQGLYF